jgi:hypothetical protein
MEPDGGEVRHVETRWARGGVTPHQHPAMQERFEIAAGL